MEEVAAQVAETMTMQAEVTIQYRGTRPSRDSCYFPFKKLSEHSTSDDKHPFLLSLYPLDDFVRPLGQTRSRSIRTSDTVELEDWRGPCEGDAVTTHTMEYFEMRVFGVC